EKVSGPFYGTKKEGKKGPDTFSSLTKRRSRPARNRPNSMPASRARAAERPVVWRGRRKKRCQDPFTELKRKVKRVLTPFLPPLALQVSAKPVPLARYFLRPFPVRELSRFVTKVSNTLHGHDFC